MKASNGTHASEVLAVFSFRREHLLALLIRDLVNLSAHDAIVAKTNSATARKANYALPIESFAQSSESLADTLRVARLVCETELLHGLLHSRTGTLSL